VTENNPLERSGPPLTPAKIAKLEAQLGAPLPDDYRRFLLESNGGTPELAHFTVEYGPAPRWMAPKWRAKWDERAEVWVVDF
jgi:hypothetical protein